MAGQMKDEIEIRPTKPEDLGDIEALYGAAFPDEDLFPLVNELLAGSDRLLSLAAVQNKRLVGHVIFTYCSVEPCGRVVALLGPLCAAPANQKQGVGSKLVRRGFEQLDAIHAMVLGDPAYYGRFGFKADDLVETPCPIPSEWKEAWQSVRLGGDMDEKLAGTLVVPKAWNDPALWSS
ncbi:N-acetyltransferase [uncultured Roseibium sp.]|uniref:GNAT family N-acetyltransferase n=1 Tax=uncultured Roseibium sp. TaxID=1936171 RepID=UPI002604BC93|nr:N-acetyltransferase [uncultured Roseibium sp.]